MKYSDVGNYEHHNQNDEEYYVEKRGDTWAEKEPDSDASSVQPLD